MLGSKVFQEAKCSRDQNVLRIKMFSGAKYESAKCAKEESVVGSKVGVSYSRTLDRGYWSTFYSSALSYNNLGRNVHDGAVAFESDTKRPLICNPVNHNAI